MLYIPKITQNDAKQHLHDIRYQRQKQLTFIIDECHQLRIKHKYIFDCQFNCYSTEKTFLIRDEYINSQSELENDLPMAQDLTDDLSESSYIFSGNQVSNNRRLLPRRSTQQRCLSVSSVASTDKRANRVYEKWPDYTETNRAAGYRITKTPTIPPSPPTPVVEVNQKKRKKSTKFVNVAKQIKDMSSIERETLKDKPIDEPPVIQKVPIIYPSAKEIKPKLPSILCPSSKSYSKRIQTRQWLIKNYFSSQILPLI